LVQFLDFVEDEQGSGHCTEEELQALTQEISAVPPLPPLSRSQLAQKLFCALAGDAPTLGSRRLLHFARSCGFAGSSKEWLQEYEALSYRYAWTAAKGIDSAEFSHFLHDEAGSGYCDDDELHELLIEIEASPPQLEDRRQLAGDLFGVLSGRAPLLQSKGLLSFARQCGFSGQDSAWHEQYVALASTFDWDAPSGADEAAFLRLVDDEPGIDTFCTDDDLFEILADMAASSHERPKEMPNEPEDMWYFSEAGSSACGRFVPCAVDEKVDDLHDLLTNAAAGTQEATADMLQGPERGHCNCLLSEEDSEHDRAAPHAHAAQPHVRPRPWGPEGWGWSSLALTCSPRSDVPAKDADLSIDRSFSSTGGTRLSL